jgi:hypothetical protein
MPIISPIKRQDINSGPGYNQVRDYANTPEENRFQGNNAEQNYPIVSNKNDPGEGILDFENRRFSYNDLVRITNKFQNNIGTGGFGSVYVGTLDDRTQVAVKLRSDSSSQGVKEFLAEVNCNPTHSYHTS